MAVTNVEPILPQLTLILEVLKYCLPLIFVLLLTLYGYWRAASGFFLIERIWRLIGGSKEFSNEFLNQQWLAFKDLESFRFRTGIPLDTYEQMLALLERIKCDKVNIAQLIRGRKYFDADRLVMRNPDLSLWKCRHAIGMALSALFMIACTIPMIPDYAILTMKKSDVTFMVREDTAKSFLSSEWSLNPQDCIQPSVKPDDEIKQLVCGIFANKADGQYVRNIIAEQRALAGILMANGFWFFVCMIVGASKAQAARRVFVQMNRSVPSPNEHRNPWMHSDQGALRDQARTHNETHTIL
ncbi:DUF6216 family protein [Pseudomonas putida]|uniref:DUF6216 family protein n=1 Tax=Pseudomonas putida TaxID=303 RepID=UPI003D962ED8